MHRGDFKAAKELIDGIIWLARSLLSIPLLIVLYIILAPVQLRNWIRGDKPFGKTEPFLYLQYQYVKMDAFSTEKILPYDEWKQKEISKLSKQ